MFSTPLTCCSIGAATVSSTSWALAPGIAGRHLHGRRRDVGILGDRQHEHGQRAGQRDDDRQHRGEDRPVDEEVGEHGSSQWFSG